MGTGGQGEEVRMSLRAIHPETRLTAGPADGRNVEVNPPPLLWPATSGRAVRYDVCLSRDPAFPTVRALTSQDQPWAMYNPHAPLEAGDWYWRVRATVDGSAQPWSGPHHFRVGDAARAFVTPTAKQMLARCPASHPRVLLTAAELTAFRSRAPENPAGREIVRTARKLLGRKLPDESRGLPKKRGASPAQAKKFANWASKSLGTKMGSTTKLLCQAYLITGDQLLGREAVRHALHVAGWDPAGVSRVNDFSDGACLRAMALAYDSCHELLAEPEKTALLQGIQARAARMFSRWSNKLETRAFNAHVWQHILHDFMAGAFATYGDLPDAALWASYLYELWINRVPLLGGNDGGWANGNNYFGTNFATLIEVPAFFEKLTGVPLLDHPWYRNTVAYMIYTWPPLSQNDGFGDGCEKRGPSPDARRLAFADLLGRRFQDPCAGWYVNSCGPDALQTAEQASPFQWHRLRAGPDLPDLPVAASLDLPQARSFRDIGVVAMHTQFDVPDRNLMVAFRSSPFGSFNHMHADQNSFNILYGGRRVFASSGYYIAYGDEHFRGWYKHSIGHNTVLIDGKGQSFSTEGYGWIPRFLHGERLSYCVGDASNGYGEAGLTRFRRHVALLRPGLVVVYDELEADHPALWTWLLHSPAELQRESEQMDLAAQTETCRARVTVHGSGPLSLSVDSAFDPPAENWRGVKNSDGSLKEYPDQWHARVVPQERLAAWRCLALIRLAAASEVLPDVAGTRDADGWIEAGGWQIRAELDPNRRARLEVRSSDGRAGLTSAGGGVVCAGQSYAAAAPDNALLVERAEAGTVIRKETGDELPAAAR